MVYNLKYLLIGIILKIFSLNRATLYIYRWIGNNVINKRHSSVNSEEIHNGHLLVAALKPFNNKEHKVLEIGTGWTHFYSIFLKIFNNCEVVLYDVQDNRKFKPFKKKTIALFQEIKKTQISEREKNHIITMENSIIKNGDFINIYNDLNMKYIVNQERDIGIFFDNEFDAIFSIDVLEHIHINEIECTISKINDKLKTNGILYCQIGLDDHINHYLQKMPSKSYLKYSETTWNTFFNSTVQYINRLQSEDYKQILTRYGFDIIGEEISCISTLGLKKIATNYRKYPEKSLRMVRLILICRKK